MATNWLYPVNAKSEYWLDDGTGRELATTPANLWKAIRQAGRARDGWYLSSGFRQLAPGDLMWIYAAGEYQFICALGLVDRISNDIRGNWEANLIWDVEATRSLEQQPIPRSVFGQIPQAPCRANPSTSAVLNEWLSARALSYSDPAEDPISEIDARRRVEAEIVRRQGQHSFRQTLLSNYEASCCATGENAEAVLEAAHITPYLGPKSNRSSNGLLLRSDVHSLFDLHLISVDASGEWVVSPLLADTGYAALAGHKLRAPKTGVPSKTALKRHHREFARQVSLSRT